MAHELSFRREKYELRDGPNSTRSDDWIKKLTFWPYLVRVLVLIAMRGILEYCNPWIIMMHLLVTLFWLWNLQFATIFFFFWFWHLFWCMNQGRTKCSIDSSATTNNDCCSSFLSSFSLLILILLLYFFCFIDGKKSFSLSYCLFGYWLIC